MSFKLENLLSSSPQTISFNDVTFDSSLDKTHPNKMPFHGTLLLLDEPSQQPPHGAEGHAIEVPKAAAEDALKSLVGMGINYKPDLEGHDPKKKIGVITEAWIEGNEVLVKGIIWPKDFPEAVRALRANRGELGMSMELGNVYVQDQDADVWVLEKFHFTGATVLKKESAAYQHTSLAASAVKDVAHAAAAAAMGSPRGGKRTMGTGSSKHTAKDQSKVLATAIAAGVESAFSKGTVPKLVLALEASNKTNGQILEFVQKVSKTQDALLASLSASGKKKTDDGDDAAVSINIEEILSATHGDPTDATASNMRARAADSSSSASSSTSAMAAKDPSSSASSSASDPTDPTTASDQRAAADPTAVDDADPSVPDNRVMNKKASEHAHTQARDGAKGQLTPGGGDGGVSASARKREVLTVSAATAKLVRDLSASLATANDTIRKQQNKIAKIEAQMERYAERIERKTLSPEVCNLLEKTGHNPMELMASGSKMSVGEVDKMFDDCGLKIDPTTRMALKNQMLAAGIMDQGIVNRQTRLM